MSIPDSPITRTQRTSRAAAGPQPAQRRKRGAPPQQTRRPRTAAPSRLPAPLVRAAELLACGVMSMIIIFVILGVLGALAVGFYMVAG